MISVVIPVYNRERELLRALKSVLNQTFQDFEVIVVDDCSEIDLLDKVVAPLGDPRLRLVRLPQKGNGNVCRNLGIKEAKGEFIAFLDSDDEWLPMHLERRMELIQQSSVDGLFGSHFVDDGIERRESLSRVLNRNESMADYLLSSGVAQTSSYFLRTAAAKITLWDDSLKRHQDYDFAIRFAQQFAFIPCKEVSVVVHWAKGEKRTQNFQSQIQFIEKHKSKISPRIYNQYHYKGFFQALASDTSDGEVINHYKRESYRFPSQVTLIEFLAVEGYKKSSFFRLWLRIRFAIILLLNRQLSP